MTRTDKRLSDALRGQGIQHRNEVRLRAKDWEYAYVADLWLNDGSRMSREVHVREFLSI